MEVTLLEFSRELKEVPKIEKQPPEIFYKKVLLKFFQYLQENSCVEVAFQ